MPNLKQTNQAESSTERWDADRNKRGEKISFVKLLKNTNTNIGGF